MDDFRWIISALIPLLIQTPLILLHFAGIGIAFVRWQKHPRISILTIVALSVSLVWLVVSILLQTWLPYYVLAQTNRDANSLAYAFTALNVVSVLIHFVTFGLLLFAIFGDRSQKTAA